MSLASWRPSLGQIIPYSLWLVKYIIALPNVHTAVEHAGRSLHGQRERGGHHLWRAAPDPWCSFDRGAGSAAHCPAARGIPAGRVLLSAGRGDRRGSRARTTRTLQHHLPACQVLLMLDVLVYRDEDIQFLFGQREQLSIFFAAESFVADRFAFVPALGKKELHPPEQALVQKQFHFRVAAKLILASSRAAMASARLTLGRSSRNSLRLRSCSK